jgi:SAM-dependent methyltransferase
MTSAPPQNNVRDVGLLEGFLSRQRGKMADRLIPPASRKGRLLDVGCGEHHRFLKSTQFADKYGLDRLAGRNGHEPGPDVVTRLDCDIETIDRLPFEDEYFDVVTMLAVFEHIDPQRLVHLMAEVKRVLKPGGLCILTTPAAWTDAVLRVLAALRLVDPAMIDEHKDAYSHAKISAILKRSGFAHDQMRFGYFEMFMNVWATARR